MEPEEKKTGHVSNESLSGDQIVSAPHSLRTFSSDMAEAVRSGEASVVKIAMAEQKKKQVEYENFSPASKKNKIFIFGSSLLVGIGLVAIAYFFLYGKKAAPVVQDTTPQIQSLVYADESKGFDVSGMDKDKIQLTIKNEFTQTTAGENKIVNLYFVGGTGTAKKTLGSADFLNAIGSSIPGRALRALDQDFMVGIHKGALASESGPFLLFTTADFDSTYAGFLEWEKKMVDDFFLMFNIAIGGDRSYLVSKNFQDSTFHNLDTRVLLDKDGTIVMMYGFLNNNTVLITTNQNTFSEVASRYTASKVRK